MGGQHHHKVAKAAAGKPIASSKAKTGAPADVHVEAPQPKKMKTGRKQTLELPTDPRRPIAALSQGANVAQSSVDDNPKASPPEASKPAGTVAAHRDHEYLRTSDIAKTIKAMEAEEDPLLSAAPGTDKKDAAAASQCADERDASPDLDDEDINAFHLLY